MGNAQLPKILEISIVGESLGKWGGTLDKRKASKVDMKKASRMKWETPKLVIFARDLGSGGPGYGVPKALLSEVALSDCLAK